MSAPTFEQTYAADVPELSTAWRAAVVEEPSLLVFDDDLATELGLDAAWLRTPDGVRMLAGQVPESWPTYAQAYAGHQFGSYSPVLGDGRALLLGEFVDPAGRRHDLHLKGSGRTPYARGGDGNAAVGPMLREYLVSEAMDALGIPTTRSLAVVGTGRTIMRERPLPGAILARVASSHLRVGTFQYAASLGRLDVLRALADHAIDRHHPTAREADDPYLALFEAVATAQARLVARWMGVGFIHGVMNTDNMTISGETIDYGPCAFLDAHDPRAVFSSIDHGGRYAYGNQPGIAQWNLARLGEALLPLIGRGPGGGEDESGEDESTPRPWPEPAEAAVEAATGVLAGFAETYDAAFHEVMAAKLGVRTGAEDDPEVRTLVSDVLALLTRERIDHTQFFRALTDGSARELVDDAAPFDVWLERRSALLDPDTAAREARMNAANPVYIPRNHVVEDVLGAATEGDLAPFMRVLPALRTPFTRRDGFEDLARPAPAGTPQHITYCGT
ncbi:protein adenylyltransferase SelO [Mobilicoccus massiliensis]|uniref:protein adenylyltransferase SelO n=1 Tax=Mobilicoccus massiliensis TaxID=1522310 RepID=UPI00058C3062|nr:YdiU family protein [Mobilicoccus massiliensis]